MSFIDGGPKIYLNNKLVIFKLQLVSCRQDMYLLPYGRISFCDNFLWVYEGLNIEQISHVRKSQNLCFDHPRGPP